MTVSFLVMIKHMTSHRNIARSIAILLTLVCCGGCAYFNTYYNGKRLYTQAQGATERQFPDTALAALGDAAYQRAIDKFASVVRNYPSSRWAQNSLYYMGLSYYYSREFQKAERKFQEIWEYYPGSRFAPQSRLNAAVIEWAQGGYEQAANILAPLREHPDRRVREKAAYLQAVCLQSNGRLDEASIAWERYLFSFYNGDLAPDGRLNYALCLMESNEANNAIRELEIVAGMRAKKKYRHQVWYLLGEAYTASGRDQDAVNILNRILAQQPDIATAAQTECMLAEITAHATVPGQALDRYLAVAKKYQGTASAAQCYFDMGALMEHEQRLDTALALYRKAKNEFPAGPLAEQALRKASDIALLLSYQKESTQTTRDQSAVLQFLMAEHYLFGLGQPDSAIAVYRRVAADFPDQRLAPKALFSAAWSYERYEQDTASAIPIYRDIINRYPATRYANGARDRLGLPPDPAVADSEPEIEFKAAAAPAAPDSVKATPDKPQPVQDKPESPEQQTQPPDSARPENKIIPGPDDQPKQTETR